MEYVVKKNDNLTKIANKHGHSVDDIIRLNPSLKSDPDTILVGQNLTLPEPKTKRLPTPSFDENNDAKIKNESEPECKGIDAHSLVYFSGEGPEKMCLLNSIQTSELEQEISTVQAMMQEFGKIVASSGPSEDSAQKKSNWLVNASNNGLIDYDPKRASETPEPIKKIDEKKKVKNDITALKNAWTFVDNYHPFWARDSSSIIEDNWKDLKKSRLAYIESKLSLKRVELKSISEPQKKANGLTALALSNSWQGEKGFKEIIVFTGSDGASSGKDKWVYVRSSFIKKKSWTKLKTPAINALLSNGPISSSERAKLMGKALLQDIKKSVAADVKKSPLGNIELKIATWKAPGFMVFDKLEAKYSSSGDEADESIRHEVNAEAQMLRFAAQASAGVNSFDLSEGSVDIGVKGQASMSLAEGKVSYSNYFPNRGGYSANLTFNNANGEEDYIHFGNFRTNTTIILSAFVGATVAGNAGTKVNLKGNTGSGEALLAPNVSVSTSKGGSIGLKGDCFAGAQCGGTIAGALEWESPEVLYKEQFKQLAGLKAEGNVAIGAGAGLDFGIALSKGGKFQFNCYARLVWGPGASGGFGVEIDGEQIWELLNVIYQGLSQLDYRYWKNIDPDAFHYGHRMLLKILTQPSEAITEITQEVERTINEWWDERIEAIDDEEQRMLEAKNLARGLQSTALFEKLPSQYLPPETLGTMLNTLVPTRFFEREELQEDAINGVLSIIPHLRKFEEVLAHMTPDGSKVASEKELFSNLNRLNAILDGLQQDEFNTWLSRLPLTQKEVDNNATFIAFTSKPYFNKKDVVRENFAQLARA